MRFFIAIWYCAWSAAFCSGCYRTGDPVDGSGEPDTDTATNGGDDTGSDTGSDTDTGTDTDSLLTGNLIWAKMIDGATVSASKSIAALEDGGAVVVGFFSGRAVLGTGEANETELQSFGGEDMVLARLGPDGSLVWAKQAGGESFDAGYGVVVTPEQEVLLTGECSSGAVFGIGEPNETVLYPPVTGNFLAKFDLDDGALVWARAVSGRAAYSIDALDDGSMVTAGVFEGTVTFGAGETNETALTARGQMDTFVARYYGNGTLVWVGQGGGEDHDWTFDLAVMDDGSVYTVGFFNQEITFGAGEPNETELRSAGKKDIFIARYRRDGTLAWAKRVGGRDDDWCESVVALSDGSVLVMGWFYDSTVIGPGEPNQVTFQSRGRDDSFLARYHPDGRLAWARQIGGQGEDVGESVSVNRTPWVAVTGSHENGALFDDGETSLAALGRNDMFVARYRLDDGRLAWAKRGGGGGRDAGKSVAAYADGCSVVTGWFQGEAIFGPGEPNETVLTSSMGVQIFIAKYAP